MVRNKPLPSELRTTYHKRGVVKNCRKTVVSAYVAEKKFIRLVIASISPEQFQKITRKKLCQIQGDPVELQELMCREIQDRFNHLDNKSSIRMWECALEEGIIPAIKNIYLYKNGQKN